MTRHKIFFFPLFQNFFRLFFYFSFCNSGNEFGFSIFPAFNFEDNYTIFFYTVAKTLVGIQQRKIFLKIYFPLNEFTSQSCLTRIL